MVQIIDFPTSNERNWRTMEAMLQETYKSMPDGPATLEECLPVIKSHWQDIFVSFSVQPVFQIPGPISEEQNNAIIAAVEKSAQLVAERLHNERANHFGLLAACEFKAAYFRRNGSEI